MCDSTLLFTRDGATLVSDGASLIVPPSSCGISFPCVTALFFSRATAPPSSPTGFTHCAPFLVWNILPMYDSTLLFMRDGAAFSLPMGPSLTVSFIVHNGGLLPSVTAPFISCVFLPRATVPSSRVQRKSSCVHDSTLPRLIPVRDGALSPRARRTMDSAGSFTLLSHAMMLLSRYTSHLSRRSGVFSGVLLSTLAAPTSTFCAQGVTPSLVPEMPSFLASEYPLHSCARGIFRLLLTFEHDVTVLIERGPSAHPTLFIHSFLVLAFT
ncbi:hypothetical protein B0H13DRAFT_2534828 [Mycena leptocephala]|nr:hypothetical protein B0H13DRAFT_2534828 [Mycena leptocephala]